MSNIGMFAQKSEVFNVPLHSSQGSHPLVIMFEHIQGGVVIFDDCTHSEKMTVSIISRWGFVLNMTFYTTRQERSQSDREIKSVPMFADRKGESKGVTVYPRIPHPFPFQNSGSSSEHYYQIN